MTHHGLPLVPGEAATIAASLDLLYDPGARVLEVLEIADDSASPGAMASASGDPFQDRRVIVAGMADTGAVLAPPRPTLAARIQFRDGAGDATAEAMLAASRLGATVAPIGRARDRLLVWGGDIDFATGGEVDAFAGEIVALDATGRPSTTALPAMPTLPAPVVLHTASPIGDDGVLVAGGLVVGSLESPGQGVTTRSPADGLVVVAPEGPNWVVRAVADDRYMPSVYHSHVTAPLGASPPVALIIGGATDPSSCDGDGDCWGDQHCEVTTGTCAIADCAPGGPCPAVKLLPSGQVVRVEEDGAGAYATEPLTPGFSPRGLLRPRFGHVVVPLAGDRLLVTGGFDLTVGDDGAPQVRTMGTAEILFYRRAPAPIPSCGE